MAGGRGERFWPQSRLSRPKHLLPIVGNRPMLAQTVDRLAGLADPGDILVITNADQAAAVRACCPQLPESNVIAEPVGRDTTAAAALANLLAARRDPAASVALLPADHVVHDAAGFRSTLLAAFAHVEAEPVIATIAIRPAHPETGYGYVHRGAVLVERGGHKVYRVRRFVEKPDLATAERYLASGEYDWNGGIFLWRAATFAAALQAHAPDIAAGFAAIAADLDAGATLDTTLARHYPPLRKISVDFAIMEKTPDVVTVPAGFDWDDVGAWPAVSRHKARDEHGNVAEGAVVLEDTRGSTVLSTPDHLVAVLGCDGMIVVRTADATLVCPAAQAQHIKKLLKRIEARPGGASLL